ncbi:MAG: FAD-binding oxidoreductase [Woeseiaceae bacterium]|nr:FAD-binding oxidoreductase [Woeseiaceae bacterium]
MRRRRLEPHVLPLARHRGAATQGTGYRRAHRPGPEVLRGCVFDDKVGIRRREDGGYDVAHGAVLDHSITPTTLRYALKFFPALRQEWRVLRISVGRDFWDELTTPVRWPLDAPSPFESTRILDPAPNPRVLTELKQNLAETFPALAEVPVVESWAGMVETTPDVVPVICEADRPAGLSCATGLSGHGFGVGPGAGKTIAAMLSGDAPDLSAFRLSRFFDGTPIRPMPSV